MIQNKIKLKIPSIRQNYSKLVQLPKNTEVSNIKYCITYIFMVFVCASIFLLNFFWTRNTITKSKYILLSPEKICSKKIENFSYCIADKLNYDRCIAENKDLETCYDQANAINRICYFYLSELAICIDERKTQNQLNKVQNKCSAEIDEFLLCTQIFKYIDIDKEKIVDLVLEKL